MTFKIGLTILRTGDILPSKWVEMANEIKLEHIEFDQTVFNDLDNVIRVLKSPQTVIHAPYVEDYGVDLSSNNQALDQFVEKVIKAKNDLNIIGVVVHPPIDASGSWDKFYDRLEKLPLPLLENMPHQSWDEFEEFIDSTQASVSKKLGMCFDIPHSWLTHGKQFLDIPEFCINYLKEPTGYIHISGGTSYEDTHYPLLTEGDMPIKPVEDFLRKICFTGTVTMELKPQSIDDFDKIFQSYMLMLDIAGQKSHKIQVKIKKPFIMRKIKQATKDVDLGISRSS